MYLMWDKKHNCIPFISGHQHEPLTRDSTTGTVNKLMEIAMKGSAT